MLTLTSHPRRAPLHPCAYRPNSAVVSAFAAFVPSLGSQPADPSPFLPHCAALRCTPHCTARWTLSACN
eukprot:6024647-Pyramimonas_sp.AAC.1